MFKKLFSFDGRIRRTEYGISLIIYYVIAITFQITVSEEITNQNVASLIFLFFIPFVWIMLAQGAKRCHDRGNSGWYQLIPFYMLWMLFADSEIGRNQYGLNPKGIGNIDDIDEIGEHLSK